MTTTRSLAASLVLFLAPCFFFAPVNRASAEVFHHCPKTVFCRPKAPCIKYKCVCPKPICPCGELENFGYYPTCWRAWPFPPNYSHCPYPPTIATAPCSPTGVPAQAQAPAPTAADQLPAPSQMPTEPKTQP